MKKKFLLGLLFIYVILAFTSSVFAYNYKVYNPEQNKAYTASLGTVGVNSNKYIFGFFDIKTNQLLCAFTLHYTNVNKEGLLGGQCYDSNEKQLGWREFSPNTFDKEMPEIIDERKQEGLYYYYEE